MRSRRAGTRRFGRRWRLLGRAVAGRAVALTALVAFGCGLATPARAESPEPIRPPFDKLERRADERLTYDANAYEIIHVESTSVGVLWGSTTAWWRPVRGVYRMPTTYGDFYRALGRSDLADREEARHATAEALYWGGLVLMVGGLIGGGYELYKRREVGALVGAGLAVGGFVSLRIGSAMSRPELSEGDAQDLAARYDRALGQNLGVSMGASF
jgi:hypothetical protein